MSRSDDARAAMGSGAWYNALEPVYEEMRRHARAACHQHRVMDPGERGACAPLLRERFGRFAEGSFIEAPFHCSYGFNLFLEGQVYFNAGCVVLDNARVEIGGGSMFGPGAQILCADHHRDPARRRAGIEKALPVTIGRDVWVGSGAILLPGITVGDGAIVAAGAVVSRDVPPGATVAGVPARPVKPRT
jgi:maltose O-acetyltransferase